MMHTVNAASRARGLCCLLAIMVFSMALAACASTQLYYSQLVALNKGMSPAQTVVVLDKPPLSVHAVEQGGKAYTFHRYSLFNGFYSDLYLLCFEQDKLKYWGYLEEFRRYPDPDINQAAEKAFDLILDGKAR